MEKLKDLFYKELPEQNRGFVEGGVLVHPQMFNIVLPTEMNDDDLYQYMNRYVTILEPLCKAQNGDEGKTLTKEAAYKLGVDANEFMKNTSLLYQLECLLAGEMLPPDFANIQKVYNNQVRRARVIMIDLSELVDPQTVQRAQQINSSMMQKQLPPPPEQQSTTPKQEIPPPQFAAPEFPIQQNAMIPSNAEIASPPQNKIKSMFTSQAAICAYALIGGYTIFKALKPSDPDAEYVE